MSQSIDLFFFELPRYTALVWLGALVGLGVAYLYLRKRARRAITATTFLDGALAVCAVGWLGARAYHLALNWEYYAARPADTIGLEGLALRGAFIGGGCALLLFARLRALRVGKLADAAALGLAAGQSVGWLGALVHGAPYGVVSASPLALELPDIYGLVAPRFPLAHAEIILFGLVLCGLLILAARRPRAGTLFWTYLLVAASAQWALGFWRGDETLMLGAWRFDQVVDAGWSALALGVLLRWKVKSNVDA